MTTKDKPGSAQFTSVRVNRDSLEPVPVTADYEEILHRDVCGDRSPQDAAAEFSASRGHPVYPARLPSRTVSYSVGELDPGAATSNHRHAYETLVYVMEGEGYTLLEGEQARRIDWQAGDAFYVPPWHWHQHVAGPDHRVRYLAATNLPLLRAQGQTVLRQEAPQD
jgi:quercetin dioxygenase-like cupin family protein